MYRKKLSASSLNRVSYRRHKNGGGVGVHGRGGGQFQLSAAQAAQVRQQPARNLGKTQARFSPERAEKVLFHISHETLGGTQAVFFVLVQGPVDPNRAEPLLQCS